MKSFKDCLADDLSTFVNLDEFAELHMVNGVEVEIVVDDDQFSSRDRFPTDLYVMSQGVYVEDKTFYIRSSDMEKPEPGEQVNLDGKEYRVSAATEENGLITVKITANRT